MTFETPFCLLRLGCNFKGLLLFHKATRFVTFGTFSAQVLGLLWQSIIFRVHQVLVQKLKCNKYSKSYKPVIFKILGKLLKGSLFRPVTSEELPCTACGSVIDNSTINMHKILLKICKNQTLIIYIRVFISI